jgi:hypothetical protein
MRTVTTLTRQQTQQRLNQKQLQVAATPRTKPLVARRLVGIAARHATDRHNEHFITTKTTTLRKPMTRENNQRAATSLQALQGK